MKTREQALIDLGRVVAEATAISGALTPIEAAERAWHPGGPSVAQLAEAIATNRAQARLRLASTTPGVAVASSPGPASPSAAGHPGLQAKR